MIFCSCLAAFRASLCAVICEPSKKVLVDLAVAFQNWNCDQLWTAVTNDAFSLSFSLMLATGIFCFLASTYTRNDSWVDRLWSIFPVVTTWIFALYKQPNATLFSMSVVFAQLITAWGIRLTFNFYRKGGYRKGGEDYRWEYVRTWPMFQVPLVWPVFSFLFISMFQIFLLWAITVPVSFLGAAPITCGGACFAALFLLFLALETLTDEQQWTFQTAKRNPELQVPGVPYHLGFCVQGAFGHSRHLNVFSEQSIWVTVFLAAAFQQHTLVHGSCIGALMLVALTISSTRLTEQMSSAKYPLYRVYQRTTPMLIPCLERMGSKTIYEIGKQKDE